MDFYDFSEFPPPTDQHILVLNVTQQFHNGKWIEVKPVWREAYFYNDCWRLWCGKYGVISTDACAFKYWTFLPNTEY